MKSLYFEALRRCAPERLVRGVVTKDMPRNVVAIGKCAAGMLEGAAEDLHIERAFVAVPDGYREPRSLPFPVEVAKGGHPQMTPASFAAGERLARFVDACDDVLFLVSGGGSACVEQPLPPFDERDLMKTNARLVASELPIADINLVRRQLSALKGGRLATRVRGASVTLVYSDVSRGALHDVASGPTIPPPDDRNDAQRALAILGQLGGCDRIVTLLRDKPPAAVVPQNAAARVLLVADNDTLVAAAADAARQEGASVIVRATAFEGSVTEAAAELIERSRKLQPGQVFVAGGEVTVALRGGGTGGRCSELALLFALEAPDDVEALFGSSDGVDGNSGAAGVFLPQRRRSFDRHAAARELARSNSFAAIRQIAEPIMISATGNNLRDLILLARR